MSCSSSIWPLISNLNGSISFFSSFVSLFPQIIETYRDKTVDGLSPYFLLAWLCGDITSLTGAILTHQLLFQDVLALYFLFNDMFVCGQYYYYGILYKNTLATTGHEAVPVLSRVTSHGVTAASLEAGMSRGTDHITGADEEDDTINHNSNITTTHSNNSSARPNSNALAYVIAVANSINQTAAQAFDETPPLAPLPGKGKINNELGVTMSWLGAMFYVGARIPQLIKNYKRKSTDGLSPFLFATTLLCNITYNISIFTSCNYIDSDDKRQFVINAMPFIFGSAGTIVFDLIYFYQYYYLYSDDSKLRELEREMVSGGIDLDNSADLIDETSALLPASRK